MNYDKGYLILKEAIEQYLSEQGACEYSEGDKSTCKNPMCLYCNLQYALNSCKTIVGIQKIHLEYSFSCPICGDKIFNCHHDEE